MENVVMILEIGCRGEVDWELKREVRSKVVKELMDKRLEDSIELEEEGEEDDWEFFGCYVEESEKGGIKNGVMLECREELGYIIFWLKDLVDLEKLNDEYLGGWNYDYRISWEEINEELEKI